MGKMKLIATGRDSFLLVDTYSGLKIVVANERNFYNDDYAVQYCGTKEECKSEKARLEKQAYSFDQQNRAAI